MPFKKSFKNTTVCIFCGSQLGKNKKYKYESRLLTRSLVNENYNIIYGAGKIGLMGEIANQAIELKGYIKGVIPNFLNKKEIVHQHLSELKMTSDLFERKKYMIKHSDAFIVLPGGIGTLDEIFDILAHTKLDLIKKPIILLNINNYWEPLKITLKHLCLEAFANEADFVSLKFSKDSNHAIRLLKELLIIDKNKISI